MYFIEMFKYLIYSRCLLIQLDLIRYLAGHSTKGSYFLLIARIIPFYI